MQAYKTTKEKFKRKVKSLTRRSNSMGYAQRKEILWQTFRGWIGYFKYADMRSLLIPLDQWYRRHLRMCIWKCWKRVKTRFSNLQKCVEYKGKRLRSGQILGKGIGVVRVPFFRMLLRTSLFGKPMLSHLYKQIHIDCETAVCGTVCTVG